MVPLFPSTQNSTMTGIDARSCTTAAPFTWDDCKIYYGKQEAFLRRKDPVGTVEKLIAALKRE